jgi:hypothetical protein
MFSNRRLNAIFHANAPSPFAYDFVPGICGTSLVDRLFLLPINISSDEQSLDTFPVQIGGTSGLTVGVLQRQVAA